MIRDPQASMLEFFAIIFYNNSNHWINRINISSVSPVEIVHNIVNNYKHWKDGLIIQILFIK